MPIPPPQSPTIFKTRMQWTVGTGATPPPNPQTQQTANLPVDIPTQLLAVDAQTFSIPISGSGIATYTATATFPALPERDNLINPLAQLNASGTQLSVDPKDQLLFITLVQQESLPAGAIATTAAAPFAIQSSNTRVPGPFLGSGTFLTFQAAITVTVYTPTPVSGNITGTVAGILYLSPG